MKIVRISSNCWAVYEEGKSYPGHIFPRRYQAIDFTKGEERCPRCKTVLNINEKKPR